MDECIRELFLALHNSPECSGKETETKHILPSKVFRDQVGKNMALGIGVGFDKEIEDVQANMKNAIKDISMGDLFELSPTLNNTMSTSPIINVAVVNNMETDMMGNLINNIKTYSNGSKNDFNYGMA